MKFFVIACAVLAVARAGVIAPVALPAIATAPVVAIPLAPQASQYHTQDAIGQYSYGYANELSAKNEIKSADGQTVGAYSYLDGAGKIQNVQYRSDVNGFRVAASNLPVAPLLPKVAPVVLPEPVKDTPEVVEARSRHLETLRQTEEVQKKLQETVAVEVKTALPAHPAVITAAAPATVVNTAPAVELIRSFPIVSAPAFSYSFGINHAGIYSVNAYSLQPQSIVTTYTAPGPLLTAPIVAEAVPIKAEAESRAAKEESTESVDVEAKTAASTEESSTQKDVEKEEEKAKE